MFKLKLSTTQKLLITVCCFAAALYGFMVKLPGSFRHYDKELHSLFYFGAAAFLNFLFVGKKWWAHALVFVGLYLMGMGIEWAQEYSNNVTGTRIHGRYDPEDIAANARGLLIFSAIWIVGMVINTLVRSNEAPAAAIEKQLIVPVHSSEGLVDDLSNQFGAALKMVENAILACPETIWNNERKFWYQGFHVLFFTDYYLSKDPVNFQPPAPFDQSEFEDRMPAQVYTKEQLLNYVKHCENRFKHFLTDVQPQGQQQRWINGSKTMDYSYVEIVLYNMRHLQHHAAQMNLILRLEGAEVPEWEFRA